jgi:ribosomal protein S18 acetylase RimI-like enzyme
MIRLMRAGDIEYGLLELPDLAEMTELLATVFSRFDPPAVAAGLSFKELLEIIRGYGKRAPHDGLTMIARCQSSSKLVGAMLTDDFASPPPEDLGYLLTSNFAPIVALLEDLDNRYRMVCPAPPGKILHLFMLGVDPDFGGRGIARTLVQLALDNGKRKGYEKAVTEATGNVSQHIFRGTGFVEQFRIPYHGFQFQGEFTFRSIVDHEAIILLERNLTID